MFITRNDLIQYFDLSSNIDATRIDKFASEQERIKCSQFLGRVLYDELLAADLSIPKWKSLLNQVKPMLIYWTYASYLMRGQIFNTATGAVIKQTDQSIPLSDQEKKLALDDVCNSARFYESELQNFLEANAVDYPNYISTAKHSGCKVFTAKKLVNNTEI